MKKQINLLLSILFFLTCTAFISCSDDDKDSDPSYDIIGTWRCSVSDGGYDEFTFSANKTGSWNFVTQTGSITQFEITSWAIAEDDIVVHLRTKGTTETPAKFLIGYTISKNELILDLYDFDMGVYVYKKQ